MANFSVSGIEELQSITSNIQNIPDDTKKNILKAMGNKAVSYQRTEGEAQGVRDTGVMLESLYCKTPKVDSDGGSVVVTFKGSRTDKSHKKATRNAEIAFINEFGKAGQTARPFIKDANDKHSDQIIDAGLKVYNEFVDNNS